MEEYLQRIRAIKNPKLSQDPEDINNNTGVFQVSVRRQNDCMVSGGYLLVGDSAWMPKPIDAGGIGPALIAGTILGKNVVDAIEANDVTEKGLWQYNLDFIEEYGYKTAGLELFRRLVQTLTNEQISYGMKHFLGNVDVEAISKGEHPDFSGLTKLGMIIRGAMTKPVARAWCGIDSTGTQDFLGRVWVCFDDFEAVMPLLAIDVVHDRFFARFFVFVSNGTGFAHIGLEVLQCFLMFCTKYCFKNRYRYFSKSGL